MLHLRNQIELKDKYIKPAEGTECTSVQGRIGPAALVPLIAMMCSLLLSGNLDARQGKIYERLPANLDLHARYLIYLHGRIIEDKGPRPSHETWGIYEYREILEALAADGLVVVSEQRPPSTDVDLFADHVADQVRHLLRAAVPPERITVVGFSKGGGIAMRASAFLRNARINFVFLASCGDGDFSRSALKVWGRILSVYEASDEVGRSCSSLFAKAGSTGERDEIEIKIGQGHGSFYRPHQEWLTPVLRWSRQATVP
jgi:pimeloyl-ACP methyl ester carboxylesterase